MTSLHPHAHAHEHTQTPMHTHTHTRTHARTCARTHTQSTHQTHHHTLNKVLGIEEYGKSPKPPCTLFSFCNLCDDKQESGKALSINPTVNWWTLMCVDPPTPTPSQPHCLLFGHLRNWHGDGWKQGCRSLFKETGASPEASVNWGSFSLSGQKKALLLHIVGSYCPSHVSWGLSLIG